MSKPQQIILCLQWVFKFAVIQTTNMDSNGNIVFWTCILNLLDGFICVILCETLWKATSINAIGNAMILNHFDSHNPFHSIHLKCHLNVVQSVKKSVQIDAYHITVNRKMYSIQKLCISYSWRQVDSNFWHVHGQVNSFKFVFEVMTLATELFIFIYFLFSNWLDDV